jgi:hypothetical protein
MNKIIKASVRESFDSSDIPCWDIECWFEDGQKFAPIEIDYEHEELADTICKFLNDNAKK